MIRWKELSSWTSIAEKWYTLIIRSKLYYSDILALLLKFRFEMKLGDSTFKLKLELDKTKKTYEIVGG
jgi:hypothetical protein